MMIVETDFGQFQGSRYLGLVNQSQNRFTWQ